MPANQACLHPILANIWTPAILLQASVAQA